MHSELRGITQSSSSWDRWKQAPTLSSVTFLSNGESCSRFRVWVISMRDVPCEADFEAVKKWLKASVGMYASAMQLVGFGERILKVSIKNFDCHLKVLCCVPFLPIYWNILEYISPRSVFILALTAKPKVEDVALEVRALIKIDSNSSHKPNCVIVKRKQCNH